MMQRWRHGIRGEESGFTLLELMMVMALLGLFALVVYAFLNYNFRFLQTHSDDQVESLELRKLADRLVQERSLYGEIETVPVMVPGGGSSFAVQAVTSPTDLRLPPPGAGLIYYPLHPAPGDYPLTYDAAAAIVYYRGQPLAREIVSLEVTVTEELILLTCQGRISGSQATETQVITLPRQGKQWAKGG